MWEPAHIEPTHPSWVADTKGDLTMTTTLNDRDLDSDSSAQDEDNRRFRHSFLEKLLKEKSGQDDTRDFNVLSRRRELDGEVDGRRGTTMDGRHRVSGVYIVENAAERYFNLMRHARDSMGQMFTEAEFVAMLNTTCDTHWDLNPWSSVATTVANCYGVESLESLPEESDMRCLLEKLVSLSPQQNAALVDVCEQVWRNFGERPLAEILAAAGMPPATEASGSLTAA